MQSPCFADGMGTAKNTYKYMQKSNLTDLERDIPIRNPQTVEGNIGIRVLRHVFFSSAFASVRTTAAGDQADNTHHDLSAKHLFAALLIVPGPRGEATLDVQLRPLAHIIAQDLRPSSVRDQVVPLRPILPLTLLVLETLRRRQRKLRDQRSTVC